ncbi:MAG TPA: hypothetical protein VFZ46_05650 [Nitrososphaeraceae archaeon]
MLKNQSNNSLSIENIVNATYIGGHKAFPKPKHTKVAIYHDRLEILELNLSIPYSFMKNIENMEDKKISKLRVVALGPIIGVLWKKKVLYTVITYNDGIDEQTIVLDLGKGVDSIQPLIYQKMLLAKKLL